MVTLTDIDLTGAREREEKLIHELGEQLGYGRLMQLAQQEWRKSLTAKGQPEGVEFAYGPCVGMTVPCGCNNQSNCDWCCGSGWLTQRVRQAQRKANEG